MQPSDHPQPKNPVSYSFDVFDTSITRRYAAPEDLQWHLGEILVAKQLVPSVSEFVAVRQGAEKYVWEKNRYKKGARIDEIYYRIAEKLCWGRAEMEYALAEEVRLETETAHAVPDIIERLGELRAKHGKYYFISDMHLLGGHINGILQKSGIAAQPQIVFVSADFGLTKRSGKLFDLVLKKTGVNAGQLKHVGDHKLSDYAVPKRKGIQAELYTRATLNRHEQEYLNQFAHPDWRYRALGAVSRTTRLSYTMTRGNWQLNDLLCSTVAPFVVGFANWVVAQAIRRGIKKLYFLARDMQIVHRIALKIVESRNLNIECHYLYASRQAWQAPSYSGCHPYELSWLCDHLQDWKAECVLRRLLEKNQIEELKDAGFDLAFDVKSEPALLKKLLTNDLVSSRISQEVARKRELLLGYLEQEGYVPDASCALVDAGWRGTLQKCLARTFEANRSSVQIVGFYAGLCECDPFPTNCELNAYLPKGSVQKLGYSLVALIESFLSADHGTTLGYAVSEGRIDPVLGASPNIQSKSQFLRINNCCVAFAHELESILDSKTDFNKLTMVLQRPLLSLCQKPDCDEASLLKEWFYDTGRDSSNLKSLVEILNLKDIARLFYYKIKNTPMGEVFLEHPWTQGCVECSPVFKRCLARILIDR